jgi:hypothetical protein
MAPWIASMLTALSGWLYPATPLPPVAELAQAIEVAANEFPLPEREGGAAETARELAVLAATEGHLDCRAVARDRFGESYGCFQLHETTLRWLGARPEDAFDPWRSAELAARLVRKSHGVCGTRPPEHALAWYASGGPRCETAEGLAASERRMRYAVRLRLERPERWIDFAEDRRPVRACARLE